MYRKWICRVLLSFIAFLYLEMSAAVAGESVNVRNADELQKALKNKNATTIYIHAPIKGNFLIPKWVSRILGSPTGVVMTPANPAEPFFKASEGWYGGSDILTISGLTIECPGKIGGIDFDSLSKSVHFDNVVFKGIAPKGEGATGIRPSTKTKFTNCTFENLIWSVSTIGSAAYDLEITECTFKNTGQALAVNQDTSKGKALITNSRGENLGYWVILHRDNSMVVTVDQKSINAAKGTIFYHKLTEKLEDGRRYGESVLEKYAKELMERENLVGKSIVILDEYMESLKKRKQTDLLSLLTTVRYEQRDLPEIDFSDSDLSAQEIKENINRHVTLYAFLAMLPLETQQDIWEDALRNFVKDENIVQVVGGKPLLYDHEPAMLGLVTPNIFWGDTGNVRDAFINKIKISTPDQNFRNRNQAFRDWWIAAISMEGQMDKIREAADIYFRNNPAYTRELQNTLREIHNLWIVTSRIVRIAYYDIPMQVVFAASYARTTNEIFNEDTAWASYWKGYINVSDKGKDRITQMAREIGPYYNISQRLCVLPATNTIRAELMKIWGKALKIEKEEDLKSLMATDHDEMRGFEEIEGFFKVWQ